MRENQGGILAGMGVSEGLDGMEGAVDMAVAEEEMETAVARKMRVVVAKEEEEEAEATVEEVEVPLVKGLLREIIL